MERDAYLHAPGVAMNASRESSAVPDSGREAASELMSDVVSVRLRNTGEHYDCRRTETLLEGLARLGRKGIPVGCVNGGCGVCKVSICVGTVRMTGAMSRAHISEQEEAAGVVLACRAAPNECVELDVLGLMKKNVCRYWPGEP
jgi:ferredoxin